MKDANAYRTWTQADPRFNREEVWPLELFPKSTFHTFKGSGCLITSLAIMLRHFGIEKEEDEEKFNPLILNKRFIEHGAFDECADLDIKYINRLYPLEYKGDAPYTHELMVEALSSGEPFLVTVPGVHATHHFIVPDHLDGDDLSIIDCAWGKGHLSEFDSVCQIRLFERKNMGSVK